MSTNTDTCPACAAQLAYKSRGYDYSRAIGHKVQNVYDGILYWSCPMCGHRWHRFPTGHHLRARAERFVTPEGEL